MVCGNVDFSLFFFYPLKDTSALGSLDFSFIPHVGFALVAGQAPAAERPPSQDNHHSDFHGIL